MKLFVFIIGFWLTMMSLLVHKEYFPKNISPSQISLPKDLSYSREWSIYSNNEKVGSFRINMGKRYLKMNLRYGDMDFDYSLPQTSLVLTDIIDNGIIPWFYLSGLRVGDKFQWYQVNPITNLRALVKIIVTRSSFYHDRPVVVIDVYYQDIKLELWADNDGNPLKAVTPWGLEIRAE